MLRRRRDPFFTTALRDSVCPETNTAIRKGDSIVYSRVFRIAYAVTSRTAEQVRAREEAEAFEIGHPNA
jgi:hypothetical protein